MYVVYDVRLLLLVYYCSHCHDCDVDIMPKYRYYVKNIFGIIGIFRGQL